MGVIPRRLRKHVRTTLITAILLITLFDVVGYHRLSIDTTANNREAGAGTQKIFIASIHWNNEAVLRGYWNTAVLALAKQFGVENVYISVYESGSWDDSKGALRELDQQLDKLGVNRTVVLDKTTHQDEISQQPGPSGWIDTPRYMRELRRIPYLSRLRNLSLSPLETLRQSGVVFDKILFLNDVVFEVDDVLALLATNGGNYAAACSLDFARPPQYYDTFALRDLEGHETIMQTWPYFRSWRSRSAIKQNKPVPVTSCWNGMVSMDAGPFYGSTGMTTSSLQFRGIADSLAQTHLEASECCLIHQDNPISAIKGVWLNPNVRVGYNKPAYDLVNSATHRMSLLGYLRASWENRLRRWFTSDWLKKWVVRKRLQSWEHTGVDRSERGVDCLINEMQVLISNGWKHL
ncbi:hypothetical protein A1O3_01583 [Capronia epimyces CBS 606.96]|uniref:Polysaccharide export protein n=1 Tax=Capronia epimyces CBS 606.96 TaxID=1182542 RepID=W9YJE8_9EURO|nr:uncharacterized protein A1O3_01583 [Capronia epimyces CBS 606.96]EXJ93027.1 hypothetical protein A1O3_01583 [Capronia epimyces CBS 606.96]